MHSYNPQFLALNSAQLTQLWFLAWCYRLFQAVHTQHERAENSAGYVQNYKHHALGNLTYESDVGSYAYGTGMRGGNAGIHAVTATRGDINTNFSYDANGNQTDGNGRNIAYSSYNKPVQIYKGSNLNQFSYGPERQLIAQTEQINGQSRQTHYIGGSYELTMKNGQREAVHHLSIAGHTMAVLKTKPNLDPISTHYLHQDHLESVVMITYDEGKVIEKNHYDAFGKKRLAIIDVANQPLYAAGFLPITDRGFTNHRDLAASELIHMKGRVYDPGIGRFLSADPHVQSPLNSQSLNRYSYVTNNPLSLTDPSGYFFSWLKKAFKKVLKIVKKIIKKVVKVIKRVIKAIEKIITKVIMALPAEIRIVAAIAVAVYAPQYLGHFVRASFATIGVTSAAAITAGTAFATGALAGLISTGSFKGALSAGLTAVAFAGIGAHFGKLASANNFANAGAAARGVAPVVRTLANGLTRAQFALQSLAHGVVGGLSSKLSGGSFSKGILTGFVNKIASPIVSSTNSFVSLVNHTVFAGVASKIAGGSFSQGARIGFMATLFNELGGKVIRRLLPGTPYTKDDLANAGLSDASKFSKYGGWNYRTQAMSKIYAGYGNDAKLAGYRQQLTDQGNWAFGYAGAAAGVPLFKLHMIGGLKQYIDGKALGTYETLFDNPRDYKEISAGFKEYDDTHCCWP